MPQPRISLKSPQKTEEALSIAVEALLRAPCMYWACDGPCGQIRDMKTCYICRTIYQLWKRGAIPDSEMELYKKVS